SGPPSPPRCIRMLGDRIKHLSPDERSTAILIKKALIAYRPGDEVESTPGIFVSDRSFEAVLMDNYERLVLLDENGEEYSKIPLNDPCFVIGDHLGFDEGDLELMKEIKYRMTISPKVLHASHCIVIVHNMRDKELD
ncbi:MAG TPA: tRNA (pseudouridine(54)-N(1))-methyltransferase TrmY, partial [Candidatus Methanofastidiosa archaeon]|nr:tRNA (pseudouridine(54)-N(1))-methyltransferase TrmY [Candidatus Methanofastidiosa archaeon]